VKIPLPTLLRRFAQFLLVLALAALLGTGWYGYERGFTRRWRESVFTEFRRHGIEVTFRKLTFDPFRGLVAREVTLFDTTDRRRTIAEIDHAVLSVDLGKLARGRPFLTSLELRDTRLSLPLETFQSQRQTPRSPKSRARLYFPNKQVHVAQADAKVLGCRVRAQGWITNPGAIQGEASSPRSVLIQTARQIVEELQAITSEGESPLIRIQFSGDMLKPNSLFGKHPDYRRRTRARNYPLDSLECSAIWHDGALELRELTLEDAKGKLRASGRWDPQHDAMDFQVESTLDLLQTAKAAGFPNHRAKSF